MINRLLEKWHMVPRLYQAIIGTVVVLAIIIAVLLFCGKEDIGTDKAVAELQQLSQNIRRHYQNRPDFWGLDTKTVLEKQMYPLSMNKNGQLVSAYQTPVLVGNGQDGLVLMPGARTFDIIYKDLNYKQCVELSSYHFDDAFWLGVSGVSLLSGDKEISFGWSGQNMLPIKESYAKKLCKSSNILIFHYE